MKVPTNPVHEEHVRVLLHDLNEWKRRALAAERLNTLTSVEVARERDEARAELEQAKADVARLREALERVQDIGDTEASIVASEALAAKGAPNG